VVSHVQRRTLLGDRVWWLVAMFLGTGYWSAIISSTGVWFFAHVVAFTALLLAVAEAWGKGRGLWVGLAFAAAVLSRQLTLFAGLALVARLWSHPRFVDRRARWLNLAGFGATAGLGLAAYLAFTARASATRSRPVTATYSSAGSKAPLRALWLSVAAITVGQLLYLNNGFSQTNTQRFTLDFMPLLFVLVAIGLRREAARGRARLWHGAIAYAALLNALVMVLLPALDGAFRALER
jgi:hypothetical protein